MQHYRYKAKKGVTETISGELEARSQEEAVELIHQQGLIPVIIEEIKASPGRFQRLRPKTIKTNDIYHFSRQLASLLKAGIPILRALGLISEQTSNDHFKSMIKSLVDGIKDGRAFSDCLANYPDVFSPLYVAMVRAGEEGGNLREMLLRLSDYLKSQEEIYSKIRTALTYPILMAMVGLGTIVFILTFVMPRIVPLFSGMGEALPLATQVLIDISQFLVKRWYLAAFILFAIIFFGLQWAGRESGRFALGRLQLRLPLFGDLILKIELVRFCRTLELLLKSGISLSKGLQMTAPVVNNILLRDALKNCTKDLNGGLSLGQSLRTIQLIPVMLCNLISVGEESGSLEETLRDVADSYEQEANEKIKILTTLLEPVMILVIGLIVGLLVMAMLLPIFQLDILAH